MMPAPHGKHYAKTHGRHNKTVLRNLRCLLCEDCGYVMYEYVILALIILLGEIAACVLGWNTWGWRGLFFGLFGGVLLGGLVYLVGFAIYAAIQSILSYFSHRHETIDGYKWTYVIIDGRVKLMAVSPRDGAISIPATLGHCPVTSIEQGIFFGCRDLISVAIPSGVTSIGNSAFKYCSSLTSVTIPSSVTSIGREAFHGCSGMADAEGFVIVHNVLYSYHGAGGSVMIPDGVTSIGEEAFLGCRGLTSVTIPASVTSIGEEAFCNCISLTSVAIPDSVTRIGKEAFQGCCGMADAEGFVIVRNVLYSYHGAGGSVTIPDGVTSIGELAFCNCISLTSVAIPNSVTSIGEGAFLGCESLTSVTILGALDDYETDIYMGGHNVFFGSVPDELVTYVTSAWTGPTDRWLGYPVVVDAAASREAPVIAPCDGAMVRHGDMRISCATDGAVDDAKAITERIGMIEDPAKRRELEDLKRDRNPRKA